MKLSNYSCGPLSTYKTRAMPQPWIAVDVDAIQKCLNFESTEQATEFLEKNIPSINIESVFDKPEYFKNLLSYHNKRKSQLAKIVSELAGLYNKGQDIVTIIPDQNTLSETIENMQSMLALSTCFIEQAKQVISFLGFDPDNLKKCRNSKAWNKVILQCIESLDPENTAHTNACKKTAELLGLIYPRIWGSDTIENNSAMIRARLYRKFNK